MTNKPKKFEERHRTERSVEVVAESAPEPIDPKTRLVQPPTEPWSPSMEREKNTIYVLETLNQHLIGHPDDGPLIFVVEKDAFDALESSPRLRNCAVTRMKVISRNYTPLSIFRIWSIEGMPLPKGSLFLRQHRQQVSM